MRLLCIALAFCSLLAGCSSQKFDQDGGDLKRSEVDIISTRMSAEIEREYPLLKHKLVTQYVDSIGQSIVSRNRGMPPLPFEFRVLKTNEVLAFSLPGGIVYVSLGMLRAVELEGQLAAAISHELAHQQLNHPLIAWRRKVNANRSQRSILDFSGDWKETFSGERGALYLDKAMEEEADKHSLVVLYQAGFDPRVYISYIQVLRKIEMSKTADVATLTSLHPPILQRMKWAKDGLAKLPPRKEASSLSSATFQQVKSILAEAAKKSGKTDKEKGQP